MRGESTGGRPPGTGAAQCERGRSGRVAWLRHRPASRMTERAAAHSLQFGTYALSAAGLLAALAVRPGPPCTAILPRDVNDQAPTEVRPGQMACMAPCGC